jgi:cytochrome P450
MLQELNGSLAVREPHERLAWLVRDYPVVRWEQGIGFFTMDDVLVAARNPDIVSMEPASGLVLQMGTEEPLIPLHLDGELHRHFRRLLDPLFTPKKMAQLEPTIRSVANELIDTFVDDRGVELYETFCVPLPSTVFMSLFGLPLTDAPLLIRLKDGILKNEGATMEEHEQLGRQAGKELRAHLRVRLEERKRDPGYEDRDDLLSRFLTFEVDGHRLNDDEILNIMHLFTIAGLDTVSGSLSCIFNWFATHPEEQARVVAKPALLTSAIEELMRYESPTASSGARWAARDTEVNGVPVRKGDMVYLCWATANLDPSAFDDPLHVDLERDGNRHLAFAGGIHRCLGSHLARSELRASIGQFHQRIPKYRLNPDREPGFQFFGMRLVDPLPIVFP